MLFKEEIRRARFLLLAVIALYLAIGTLYAVHTPAWQAPDEPAHYNYIRQLAQGRLPVIEPADYDEAYRAAIVSAGFGPGASIEPLTYEDWQPPLYYLLQTPLFVLFDGALLPLRLLSLLLGAGVVVAAYGAARAIWPDRVWLALSAAIFVAFLPQHVAILASVNNDSLAELLIALMLILLLRLADADRGDVPSAEAEAVPRAWLAVGVLLGLGFLTKGTAYLMAPIVALALFRYWRDWSRLLRAGALAFLPAALLGAPWWLRNVVVYGGLDPLATQAHDAVVVGQLRTADWMARVGAPTAVASFARTTFRSFWGQFGWMGVVMDSRIYTLLFLFSVAVLLGLLLALHLREPVQPASSRRPAPTQIALLLALLALNIALYLGYNVTFVQHQGRYLFPALIPVAIGVAMGVGVWVRLAAGARVQAVLTPLALGVLLVALDLLALFCFILPQLAGAGRCPLF
ncbi:MAG: DUF2142 domain-containing protein [Candidatus Promineifilaceae bacterium]|nr:DUF2142 domain-containing protein [Candidatus Promineifilaceae bacterium]